MKSILRSHRSTTIALVAAFALSQIAVCADEVKSSSVHVSTPAGSASTSVHTTNTGVGSSTTSHSSATTPGGIKSNTYHAQAGPGGAKVSSTKRNVHANADGSVSATREHESHAVGDAGSAHKKSASSTTVAPDGTTSTVKHEAKTTTP